MASWKRRRSPQGGLDLDLVVGRRSRLAAAEPVFYRRRCGLPGRGAKVDVALGRLDAMSRIVAKPAETGRESLRPGVQAAATVGRVRVRLIPADEPGRRAEAAAGGEEEIGRVTADAMAEPMDSVRVSCRPASGRGLNRRTCWASRTGAEYR